MARWLGVPVIWAATSSPTLTSLRACTRPVSLVVLVTVAVTDGPAPPMVTEVRLTASTRPVSSIRSCSSPFPPALPGSPGRVLGPPPPVDGGADTGADTLGIAPPAALATGAPLVRKKPTATPATAATTATATAIRAENPGTPPWPQPPVRDPNPGLGPAGPPGPIGPPGAANDSPSSHSSSDDSSSGQSSSSESSSGQSSSSASYPASSSASAPQTIVHAAPGATVVSPYSARCPAPPLTHPPLRTHSSSRTHSPPCIHSSSRSMSVLLLRRPSRSRSTVPAARLHASYTGPGPKTSAPGLRLADPGQAQPRVTPLQLPAA